MQQQVAERAGEVIAASTTEFTAEALELHSAPPFGSFVKVIEPKRPTIYALVSYVETGGLDPTRHAVARSRPPSIVDEEIYVQWPELRDVLRTVFTARVIGHIDARGAVRHWLPPFPASLHFSVFVCTTEEIQWFTRRHDYLAGLIRDPSGTEELTAAAIRTAVAAHSDQPDYLLQAARSVARMLASDYIRLHLILQSIASEELRQ
ncbi:MAG: hypothetical protein M1296_06625 [Chloroflexi bacterium]|nr:hypothetical protein [Chloroflexota bacterium]